MLKRYIILSAILFERRNTKKLQASTNYRLLKRTNVCIFTVEENEPRKDKLISLKKFFTIETLIAKLIVNKSSLKLYIFTKIIKEMKITRNLPNIISLYIFIIYYIYNSLYLIYLYKIFSRLLNIVTSAPIFILYIFRRLSWQ